MIQMFGRGSDSVPTRHAPAELMPGIRGKTPMSTQAEVEPTMAVLGPLLAADALTFWEGSREGRFVIQLWPDIQRLIWPQRPMSRGANDSRPSGSKSRVVAESGPSSYLSPLRPGFAEVAPHNVKIPPSGSSATSSPTNARGSIRLISPPSRSACQSAPCSTASSGPAIDSSGG
jgi:hypothetical protein